MSHKVGHKLKKDQKKRTKTWQKRSNAKGVDKPSAKNCRFGVCKNPGSRTAADRKREREKKREDRQSNRSLNKSSRSSNKKSKPSSSKGTPKSNSARKRIFKRKKTEVVQQKSKNPRFL